ncbi:MAG: hypothetical protein U0136_07795 [Bdellovibrionota bacterium]
MYVTRECFYVGTALMSVSALGTLFVSHSPRKRLFCVILLLLLVVDFAMGYFIVDFNVVQSDSFTGWVIDHFYLKWVSLHMPGMLPLGGDEVVEEWGATIAAVGYFGALVFWAAFVTALEVAVLRLLKQE